MLISSLSSGAIKTVNDAKRMIGWFFSLHFFDSCQYNVVKTMDYDERFQI